MPYLALAFGFVVMPLLAAGWWLRRRMILVSVDGPSMQPTYMGGSRVLVRRTGLAGVERGAVVVLSTEDRTGRRTRGGGLLIKRAAALPGDPVPAGIPVEHDLVPEGCLVVLGDNAAQSYDSRRAGYFTSDSVVGVVVRSLSSGRRVEDRANATV